MADKNTFPQTGDTNDAAQFAQMIGQSNLTDFVEQGLRFTPDYTVPEVSISDGVCYIHTSTTDSSADNITVEGTGYVLQVDSDTLSLDDNSTNYIYVHANLNAQDDPYLQVHSSEQSTDSALLIGTIDTSSDEATEFNRYPTLEAESLDVQTDITTTSGTTIWDSENEYIPQSSVEQGSGSDLDADTLDGVELRNIDWDNVALSQSDVNVSDLGAADASLDINGYDLSDGAAGATIWDSTNQYIPHSQLSENEVTVNAGTRLTGGGTIALGESVTLSVNDGSGSGLDADTVDGFEATELGSGASDDGTSLYSSVTDFNFSSNLGLTDDGDGTVTIDVEQGDGSGLDADTVDGMEAADLGSGATDSGTSIYSSVTDFNFNSNINVTDDGDGTVTLDVEQGSGSGLNADTVDGMEAADLGSGASDSGTEIYSATTDFNFLDHLNVVDDGDGTVSIDPTHDHGGQVINPASTRTEDILSVTKTLEEGKSETIGSDESMVVADEYTVDGELTVDDGGSLKVV